MCCSITRPSVCTFSFNLPFWLFNLIYSTKHHHIFWVFGVECYKLLVIICFGKIYLRGLHNCIVCIASLAQTPNFCISYKLPQQCMCFVILKFNSYLKSSVKKYSTYLSAKLIMGKHDEE